MPNEKVKTPAARSEVELATVHTHGGEQYKAGDKIKVTETQKAWMAKRGLIKEGDK